MAKEKGDFDSSAASSTRLNSVVDLKRSYLLLAIVVLAIMMTDFDSSAASSIRQNTVANLNVPPFTGTDHRSPGRGIQSPGRDSMVAAAQTRRRNA